MKNNKAALELSIGTIVIIVLAMAMLILGLILVRNIFSGGTNAVDRINQGVINEIERVFSDPNQKIAIIPKTRKINLEQGSRGSGIALSIKNTENREKNFEYKIFVERNFDSEKKCDGITKEEINEWLDIDSGSFTLGRGQKPNDPDLITFTIPEDAPLCTILFKVEVRSDGKIYDTSSFQLVIESKR